MTTRPATILTGTRCSSARPTCSSCAAWPGAAGSSAGSPAPTPPGMRTGYFVAPSVDGAPDSTISLLDPDTWTVDTLDFDWDVMRPTEVDASQVDLTQSGRTGTDVNTDSSGLDPLDDADYPTYLGQSSTLLLTRRPTCEELSYGRHGRAQRVRVLRPLHRGSGRGAARRDPARRRCGDDRGRRLIHSGNWLVGSVRHQFSLDSWKMAFTLVRNAMGPPAAGGALRILPSVHWRDRGGRGAVTGPTTAPSRTSSSGCAPASTESTAASSADVDAATMRIKAMVPSVLGETPTGWCMPCVPYAGPNVGFAFLPEAAAGVWIEFEGGDVSYPIWVGGYWREGEVPGRRRADVKVIVTPPRTSSSSTTISGSITLSDPNGNTVTLDSSGITLANGASTVVVGSQQRVGQRRRAGGAVESGSSPTLPGVTHGRYAFPFRSTRARSRPRRRDTPSTSTRWSVSCCSPTRASASTCRSSAAGCDRWCSRRSPTRWRRPCSCASSKAFDQWLAGVATVDDVQVATSAGSPLAETGHAGGDGQLHAGGDADRRQT